MDNEPHKEEPAPSRADYLALRQALREERERLTARLIEIDRLMGDGEEEKE